MINHHHMVITLGQMVKVNVFTISFQDHFPTDPFNHCRFLCLNFYLFLFFNCLFLFFFVLALLSAFERMVTWQNH